MTLFPSRNTWDCIQVLQSHSHLLHTAFAEDEGLNKSSSPQFLCICFSTQNSCLLFFSMDRIFFKGRIGKNWLSRQKDWFSFVCFRLWCLLLFFFWNWCLCDITVRKLYCIEVDLMKLWSFSSQRVLHLKLVLLNTLILRSCI